MSKQDAAVHILAPFGTASSDPRGAQRLAGTGTTEAATTVALTPSRFATLVVGAAAVRITFHTDAPAAGSVATTSTILGAYSRYDWFVDPYTRHVAVEAADGAAAYEAWVWTSSSNL